MEDQGEEAREQAQASGASTRSKVVTELKQQQERLEGELRAVEQQVYDLEGSYLADSAQQGNVLKGVDNFLSQQRGAHFARRKANFKAEDRLFSLSSTSSPAVSFSLLCYFFSP